MTIIDKPINLNDVEAVLRNSLALEEDVEITPTTNLIDLGVEPIDVLDIYFRLGMQFSDYTSGERLNDKAKKTLYRIAELSRRRKEFDKTGHFFRLAQSQTVKEYINGLVVQDLLDIRNSN